MSEELFSHKHTEENGDIVEIRIWEVPASPANPEGVSYSFVYIREGKRVVGYDNFEGHAQEGKRHHRHIKERMEAYEFADIWKLMSDFNEDIEKIKRGVIK